MSGTNGIGVCFSFWDAEQIPSNVSVMEMVTPYYVLCRKKRLSNFPMTDLDGVISDPNCTGVIVSQGACICSPYKCSTFHKHITSP